MKQRIIAATLLIVVLAAALFALTYVFSAIYEAQGGHVQVGTGVEPP
jgi:hypothetical protein